MVEAVIFEQRGSVFYGECKKERSNGFEVQVGNVLQKVKASQIVIELPRKDGQFLVQAETLASDVDMDLLWDICDTPSDDFIDIKTLTQLYFGDDFNLHEEVAMLLALRQAPIFFQRKGTSFRPQAAETLAAAKKALERKAANEALLASYIATLESGEVPAEIAQLAPSWLLQIDKKSIAYQAVKQVIERKKQSLPQWLLEHNLIESAAHYHRYMFVAQHLSGNESYPQLATIAKNAHLPLAAATAFSIDSAATDEIDDAFSVQYYENGMALIGVHIAAPTLEIAPNDALDIESLRRGSTVYTPREKMPMLPQEVIQNYSLNEGTIKPAFSLYFSFDKDGTVGNFVSKIERIEIEKNLRYDALPEALTADDVIDNRSSLVQGARLATLFKVSQTLHQKRLARREAYNMPPLREHKDYVFNFKGERVDISIRKRSALDFLVAELMIIANSQWAQHLSEHNISAMYRTQSNFKSKTQTQAAPHHDLGVETYFWGTSPLRRYSDILNQWQLKAVIEDGVAARLSAPFQDKANSLLERIVKFEQAYGDCGNYQRKMEAFWSMRWLKQENITQLEAVTLKNGRARLEQVPLVVTLDREDYPAGQSVYVQLVSLDELNIEARVEVLRVIE